MSMVPTGPDDANVAHLMIDDVIQEDEDESDGTNRRVVRTKQGRTEQRSGHLGQTLQC